MSFQFTNKPGIAFFDFACCEGCQLTVLRLNQTLIDLLAHIKIVAWREVMTSENSDYDIAFCEGSISSNSDLERIRQVRKQADIVAALGTCASIGCHNALKNKWTPDHMRASVYGDPHFPADVITPRPVAAVVPVDYHILGCPVSTPELVTVIKCMLTGQKHQRPNEPVCVECKRNDTLCVFEKGLVCMGPVTRCGCNAVCTSFGDACRGCRGLMEGANLRAAVQALTADNRHSIMMRCKKNYDLSENDIYEKFTLYNHNHTEDIKHDRDQDSSSHPG